MHWDESLIRVGQPPVPQRDRISVDAGTRVARGDGESGFKIACVKHCQFLDKGDDNHTSIYSDVGNLRVEFDVVDLKLTGISKIIKIVRLSRITCSPDLSEMKVAELNGVPGTVESAIAMSGRQCSKLSLNPKQFSGAGRTLRVLTDPCLQLRTS